MVTRQRTARASLVAVVLVTAAALGIVAAAPLHVVLGVGRLVPWVTATAGAWLVVRRMGAVDLSLGASMGAGAATAVACTVIEVPIGFALVAGPLAGMLVGALAGALAGRLGRRSGALATLALGLGAVAILRAVVPGGAAGFHAVPLLTGADRPDVAVATVAMLGALLAAGRLARSRAASMGAVAADRPEVLDATGHDPVVAAARFGAAAGLLLGLGGALQAILSGSVGPAAYGLPATAGLGLAALLGGAAPAGPLLAAALVWGPSILFPLAPGVGTSPPLLVAGAIGLAVLAARRGRPLLPDLRRSGGDGATGDRSATRPTDPDRGREKPGAPTSKPPVLLAVDDLDGVSFQVRGGAVVALLGPNGAGKSTLLARIAGQLPDHGRVRLDGERLPDGGRARARAGIARTWQRAPHVAPADLFRAAGVETTDVADDPAVAQVQLVARQRPRVALLDEPEVSIADLAAHLARLTAAGTAVVLVDHRSEAQQLADHTLRLAPRRDAERRPQVDATAAWPLPPPSAGQPRLVIQTTAPRDGRAYEVDGGVFVEHLGASDDWLFEALRGELDAHVLVDGRPVPAGSPRRRVARGLVVVEDAEVAEDVSVGDHVASLVGPRHADRLLAGVPLLAGRDGDLAGVLSGGERRMLAFVLALAHAPRVLVLDRADHGMDPVSRAFVRRRVAEACEAGMTALVRPAHDQGGQKEESEA